jgi:hypothetical protein
VDCLPREDIDDTLGSPPSLCTPIAAGGSGGGGIDGGGERGGNLAGGKPFGRGCESVLSMSGR